ncbi:MAG TPA: alpha-L-rhamnosidase, partial [bacterium]|nr:alpha-L-rhamnosidase [bacterium]
MSSRLGIILTISLIVTGIAGCQSVPQGEIQTPAEPVNLTVEYAHHPLGIDTETPRFGWQMEAPAGEHGYAQTAYRIVVSDDAGNVVWDSDKVNSDISVGIEYNGEPLKAATRYNWELTVWDQDGNSASGTSWFETGLMNPDPDLTAWDGATWIGGGSDDLVFYSHYLSVFKMQYTIQLDEASGSTKAGIVFGANDRRLMDKYKNIYQIESSRDDSYIEIELDISAVDGAEDGQAKLNIYRSGYHPDDNPGVPLFSADIPTSLINAENKYNPHNIYLESVFGSLSLYINGTENEHRISNPEATGRGGGTFNVNPVGRGGNYIAFPMIADIGFAAENNQTAYIKNFT